MEGGWLRLSLAGGAEESTAKGRTASHFPHLYRHLHFASPSPFLAHRAGSSSRELRRIIEVPHALYRTSPLTRRRQGGVVDSLTSCFGAEERAACADALAEGVENLDGRGPGDAGVAAVSQGVSEVREKTDKVRGGECGGEREEGERRLGRERGRT